MKAYAKNIEGLWRVVETVHGDQHQVVRDQHGTAYDGGGFVLRHRAETCAVKVNVREQQRSAVKTQSVIANKERFKDEVEARKWVEDHDFKVEKVDETETSFRFRQFDPDRCQEGTIRSKGITDGVTLVVCRLKED